MWFCNINAPRKQYLKVGISMLSLVTLNIIILSSWALCTLCLISISRITMVFALRIHFLSPVIYLRLKPISCFFFNMIETKKKSLNIRSGFEKIFVFSFCATLNSPVLFSDTWHTEQWRNEKRICSTIFSAWNYGIEISLSLLLDSREIYDYIKCLYAQTSYQKSSINFLELLKLLGDRFQYDERKQKRSFTVVLSCT